MLLLYKAALTQIILWEFFESLRQKSCSCSNLHLSGEEDRVVQERENQKAGNSRLRINARSSLR